MKSALRAFALILILATPSRAQGPGEELTYIPLPNAYWSFDVCHPGPGGVMDDSEGENPLQLAYNAHCTQGLYGQTGEFDGFADHALTAGGSDPRLNFTETLTISVWVQPDSVTQEGTIVAKWASPDSYRLWVHNGSFFFGAALASGSYAQVSAPAVAGRWSHLAATFDGRDGMKLYVDGVLRGSLDFPSDVTLRQSAQRIYVGNHPAWARYDGRIDELRLYATVLTPAQVAQTAALPSNLGNRGLHLLASARVPNGSLGDPEQRLYTRDLSLLQQIPNIDAVESILVTAGGDPAELQRQRDRLTQLKAAVGNHVTWVLRASPRTPQDGAGYVDVQPGLDYYIQGYVFAHGLSNAFQHIQALELQNVYIEVASEPNVARSGFVYQRLPVPWAYHEFFRGVYDGQRANGFAFPLIYAGLRPSADGPFVYGSDRWYKSPGTAETIESFAAKVGARIFWDWGMRNGRTWAGGRYYESIQELLEQGGVTPREIVVTGFNVRRGTIPSYFPHDDQSAEFCSWWRDAWWAADSGSWVGRSFLYLTGSLEDVDNKNFTVSDEQVDDIRECRL